MENVKLIYLIFILLFIGCNENQEIIIREADENCSCVKKIQTVKDKKIDEILKNQYRPRSPGDFMSPSPSVGSGRNITCDNEFFEEGENKTKFAKTKTFEIYNGSETKVYEVMIQIKQSGKVSYENFIIEPTQNLTLGCNFTFDANLNKIPRTANLVDIDELEFGFFEPVEYRIHKVNFLSEY